MIRIRGLQAWALLALPLAVTACERQDRQTADPVPPGVSLDPPRAAPATGGLLVPGVEADTAPPAVGAPADTTPADTLAAPTRP